MGIDYMQVTLGCVAWIIGINACVELLKRGGVNKAWLPVLAIVCGVLSGFLVGPKIVGLLGIEVTRIEGGFFGLGAGANATWAWEIFKNWVQRQSNE